MFINFTKLNAYISADCKLAYTIVLMPPILTLIFQICHIELKKKNLNIKETEVFLSTEFMED